MSVQRQRLFFALWPDDRVRQALFHWQTHSLPGDLRWAHRADLHDIVLLRVEAGGFDIEVAGVLAKVREQTPAVALL